MAFWASFRDSWTIVIKMMATKSSFPSYIGILYILIFLKQILLRSNCHTINCTYLAYKLISFDMCMYLWNHHCIQDNKHIHHLQKFPECPLHHSLLLPSNPLCSEVANDLLSDTTEQFVSSSFILIESHSIYSFLSWLNLCCM